MLRLRELRRWKSRNVAQLDHLGIPIPILVAPEHDDAGVAGRPSWKRADDAELIDTASDDARFQVGEGGRSSTQQHSTGRDAHREDQQAKPQLAPTVSSRIGRRHDRFWRGGCRHGETIFVPRIQAP